MAWVDGVGGWVVSTRAEAIRVMRDDAAFTVDDPRFSTAQVVGPSMLSRDGAEHRRHREPFADAFRPTEVTGRYATSVDRLARQLVGDLVPKRHAELRTQLAGPLAVGVVALSLGLEQLDPRKLLQWYDEIVGAVERVAIGEPVGASAMKAFENLGHELDRAIRDSDSVLVNASNVLTRDDLISNAAVFLFGGIETSEGMTANAMFHLLSNVDQLDLVRADRALVDAAVEESLRLEPAAARVDRYATSDIELAGAHIAAGDLVVVSLTAANRDPDVFDRPDRYDVRRPNARSHLAFAQGPHACIGAQLARMETRAAITAVLDLLPDIELVSVEAPSGSVFRKPRSLHARWTTA
ncbi:MAG: hypothetical protein RLZZ623_519 [Actinomycetota bacterium]